MRDYVDYMSAMGILLYKKSTENSGHSAHAARTPRYFNTPKYISIPKKNLISLAKCFIVFINLNLSDTKHLDHSYYNV